MWYRKERIKNETRKDTMLAFYKVMGVFLLTYFSEISTMKRV